MKSKLSSVEVLISKALIDPNNTNKKVIFKNCAPCKSLAKSRLSSVEVLISKGLIDSIISHNEFILINNMP